VMEQHNCRVCGRPVHFYIQAVPLDGQLHTALQLRQASQAGLFQVFLDECGNEPFPRLC
jgi:hypothetical protein